MKVKDKIKTTNIIQNERINFNQHARCVKVNPSQEKQKHMNLLNIMRNMEKKQLTIRTELDNFKMKSSKK